MSKKTNFKLDSWADLIRVSIMLNKEKEEYLVPMGYHGLKGTRVVLSADDEIKQELDYHDENKWSKEGTIVLIGTEY